MARLDPLARWLCCIPKILKNESNSQLKIISIKDIAGCVVSQRYSKMKAIHNYIGFMAIRSLVVLYPKDTQKWKQFTTPWRVENNFSLLCCIPKILKNESNSQLEDYVAQSIASCVVSQRYSKMKAIHNGGTLEVPATLVVLYPKDTQKWKQFTTVVFNRANNSLLCCIPKILKNESNSQRKRPNPI